MAVCPPVTATAWSLSARRAWIEILSNVSKEDVAKSLSARRAWIEIMIITESYNFKRSLSARRAWIEIRGRHPHNADLCGRSPQGERG